MNNPKLAEQIIAYMAMKGYQIFRNPGEVNIVYLEGSDDNGQPNKDRLDDWDDRRMVIMYNAAGQPYIALNALATSEPGKSATNSRAARQRGGVARVKFGQATVWRRGFHKGNPKHPALVQYLPLQVWRDKNCDGKRTGDPEDWAAGINHHSTSPKYKPGTVGNWSEGCYVGCYWDMHLLFIALCDNDPRYVADKNFLYTITTIAGDDFWKWTQMLQHL